MRNFIEFFLGKNDLEKAVLLSNPDEFLEIIKRPISEFEFDHSIVKAIDKMTEQNREKYLNIALDDFIRKAELERARKFATSRLKRDLSEKELDEIFSNAFEKGMFKVIEDCMALLGRSLTKAELNCLIFNCVNSGFIEGIEYCAKMLGRKPSKIELIQAKEKNVKKGNLSKARLCAAGLGVSLSGEELEVILTKCVENSKNREADECAQMLIKIKNPTLALVES